METNLKVTTLHQLLDYDIRKLTRAEVQLRNSLSEWLHIAGSAKLKVVIQQYQTFVERHVQKMEGYFEEEKISSFSLPNRIMQSFIDETNEMLFRSTQEEVRDVSLLACLQEINHYKISTYGTAAAFAKTLLMEKIASVFHEAEINEKYIDDQLSLLAEHEINRKAKAPIVLSK